MTNCSWGYFKVVYKPCGLLFGWLYKTGNTVQILILLHYMYYGDNFTTVCFNKMLFFVKKMVCYHILC